MHHPNRAWAHAFAHTAALPRGHRDSGPHVQPHRWAFKADRVGGSPRCSPKMLIAPGVYSKTWLKYFISQRYLLKIESLFNFQTDHWPLFLARPEVMSASS